MLSLFTSVLFFCKLKDSEFLNHKLTSSVAILFDISHVMVNVLHNSSGSGVLSKVEELHLNIEIEEEIDATMREMTEDRLEIYYEYCSCKDHLTMSLFCSKLLQKYWSQYHKNDQISTMRKSAIHLGRNKTTLR